MAANPSEAMKVEAVNGSPVDDGGDAIGGSMNKCDSVVNGSQADGNLEVFVDAEGPSMDEGEVIADSCSSRRGLRHCSPKCMVQKSEELDDREAQGENHEEEDQKGTADTDPEVFVDALDCFAPLERDENVEETDMDLGSSSCEVHHCPSRFERDSVDAGRPSIDEGEIITNRDCVLGLETAERPKGVRLSKSGKRLGRPPKSRASEICSSREMNQEDSAAPVGSSSRIELGMKPRGRPKVIVKKSLPNQRRHEVVPNLDCLIRAASRIKLVKKRGGGPPRNHASEFSSKKAVANAGDNKTLYGKIEEEDSRLAKDDIVDQQGGYVSQTSAKKRRFADSDSSDSGRSNAKRFCKQPPSTCLSQVGDQTEEACSMSEILSRLRSIAKEPTSEFSFISMTIGFFTEVRLRLFSDVSESRNPVMPMGRKRGRKKKVASSESASSEEADPDCMQISHWANIGVESNSEGECRKRKGNPQNTRQNKKAKPAGRSPSSASPNAALDVEQGITNDAMEKIRKETPTVLILTFLIDESDALPSVADLINIFSRFGPLNEEEIEILRDTSRAKVVFRYCDDAEKAFHSAGKCSVFGKAVVSYRLRYLFSAKPSSDESPQNNNGDEPNKESDSAQ